MSWLIQIVFCLTAIGVSSVKVFLMGGAVANN